MKPICWNIHPMVIDCARAYKEAVKALEGLGPNPPREIVAEIEDRLQESLEQFGRKDYGILFPDSPFASPYISGPAQWPPSDEDLVAGDIEWLHFRRFRESIRQAGIKAKQGDPEAYRRINRTQEEYFGRLMGEQQRPFKENLQHNIVMEIGLPGGLDSVSESELADFFDEFCPCGETHDPDALKKMRKRVMEKLLPGSASHECP